MERQGPRSLRSAISHHAPAHAHYRANQHFKDLITWLREHGVTCQKPIHTRRKEFGRLITEQYGIYAASRMLRHSSIDIIAKYYADDTRRLSTGLEKLLPQGEGAGVPE